MDPAIASDWWSLAPDVLLSALRSSPEGLEPAEAARRLARAGGAAFDPERTVWPLLLRQLSSPLVLILLFGAGVSAFLGEAANAGMIGLIVLASAVLTFSQEWRAHRVVSALRRRLALRVQVLRGGKTLTVPASALVPGDLIRLSAGQLVPADGRVLQAQHCRITQASLTGESLPVEKSPGICPAQTPLARRSNCVHMSTVVRSGSATVVVVQTGRATVFGQIGLSLSALPPPTEFARGVHQFEALLMRTMVAVVLLVMAVNHALGRPALDSMLFAVALAVGLTPELLPAIVSITMSRGARALAHRGVMVRRLEAIEDLGSMDILCTDKTGTLTEDQIHVQACVDLQQRPSQEVMQLAFLNASLQSAMTNPIDEALRNPANDAGRGLEGAQKVDEIAYDFQRKRLSVVVRRGSEPAPLMITKGSFDSVLSVCAGGADLARQHQPWYEQASAQGLRVLALATRRCPVQLHYGPEDEQALELQGFVLLGDRLKPGMAAQLRALKALGLQTKIVSGDNRYICARVAEQVGLDPQALLTGAALDRLSDEALWAAAPRTDLFVEVDPQQKERIVRALQRAGHSVGFMGDGINDAPALHAADVGISAERAADIARQSADIVMLTRHLDVLRQGVVLGRTTFANTLKYIGITTSANFGNMISMAMAVPLLPWLPLQARQILLNNLLSDLPALGICTDRVEPRLLEQAQRWDARRIRRFMMGFGLISTVFDLLTFALLWWVFEASEAVFQTSWFVISVLTELAVMLVLRTRAPCWSDHPGFWLGLSTACVAAGVLVLPYLGRVSQSLGLVPLPAALLASTLAVVLAYVLCTELCKRWIWRP
ncbi:MAG: magnesium-translocating P-type ATPase [Betaproteobacteria bacterium]